MHDKLAELRCTPEFAEEKLVALVQSLLEEVLIEKGMSKSDLAKKMGVSRARISQMFSDNQNFTLRLVALAFHAMGEELHLERASKRVSYKGLSINDGAEAFEKSTQEITHGFEWLDGQMTLGPQAVGQKEHTKLAVAEILADAFATVRANGQNADGCRQGIDRERHVDRSSTANWLEASGSNVVPLGRKRALGNG